ncbi:MAG TPA: hypothetical protein VLY85_00450 [Thermoplasmata archaeon]|nr:hypothetical protein [Thermoplasmata archaeon]
MAQAPSALAFVFLVAVVLVAGGAVGAYVYVHSLPVKSPAPFVVHQGDNVTVNYIGLFGSGPDDGKVFDTSLYSVATNQALFPKALQYQPRGAPGNYTALPVHVGPNTPSSGYSFNNQSFIQVVTGFWQGLVGLQGNQSHVVVVPPSLGYGPESPACLESEPLVVEVPIVVTEPGAAFAVQYPGVLATTGATFDDPTYGWPVYIFSANASSVTLENLAYVGETSSKPGWTVEVTNVNVTANGTGLITVRNEITPTDIGHLAGTVTSGRCGSTSYIISAVNYSAGTYTKDFNREVTGQTLVFVVTVIDIYRPIATVT